MFNARFFQWFPLYGPDFTLCIDSSLRKSDNSQTSLDETLTNVRGMVILNFAKI